MDGSFECRVGGGKLSGQKNISGLWRRVLKNIGGTQLNIGYNLTTVRNKKITMFLCENWYVDATTY